MLNLDFLISCRNNNVIPTFLQFKVLNKQLRSSAGYIPSQKRLLNQEILNKQKAVKPLKPMLETNKENLNVKMNYIDFIHVGTILLVFNDKNILRLKKHKVRSYPIYYLIT